MPPRIAITLPHSGDCEYSARAIPQYERAVALAGGEPVRVPLDQTAAAVMKIVERCDGVLLPGSKADVDPVKFNGARSPHTASADSRRETVDELLLQDAYNLRKPILGICYGLQSLNVFREGSLIQHIPDFLPAELRTKVNHEAGRLVAVAHTVDLELASRLAEIVVGGRHTPERRGPESEVGSPTTLPVNSSHHQAADVIGDGLRVVARCPDDGIVEALEGISPDHFVLAVQWHPERSADSDEGSRSIFCALVTAASGRSNGK